MIRLLPSSRNACLLLALGCLLATGCWGSPPAEFRLNHVYLTLQAKNTGAELKSKQQENLKEVLEGFFGTPDEPEVPALEDVDMAALLDISKLQLAAGPVGRDEAGRPRGLYREHCAHCHGVSGDGAGPTAQFLNPYPRDYRRGLFKFKSTPATTPPTHDDLTRILYEGIPGTAMPSFRLLPGNELDALVQYVRYLSIRGELERQLIFEMTSELEEGELLVDSSADEATQNEQLTLVRSIAGDIVQKWVSAQSSATPVPPRPEVELAESIDRGRELFYGATANCVKCHGPTALGDGQMTDYDEWTKELDPKNDETVALLMDAGAMQPRTIKPRNLRLNVFRGGRRPVDLYWRIHNGIAGSPMPAAAMKPEGAAADDKRLAPEDLWHLIDYVRHLPYESVSQPAAARTNQRERS